MAETRLIEQPLAENVRAVLVDRPELYDRDTLYGAGGDYPDNPRRFAFLCRAALEYALSVGRDLRHPARARLAGRSRAGVPAHALCRRAAPQRHDGHLHDSQPRVSGKLSSRLARTARAWPRAACRWTRSSSGGRSASSRAASSFRTASRRSARPTRARFRPRNTGSASTACWRRAQPICTAS